MTITLFKTKLERRKYSNLLAVLLIVLLALGIGNWMRSHNASVQAKTDIYSLFKSDPPIEAECTHVSESDLYALSIQFTDISSWKSNFTSIPEASSQEVPFIPDSFKLWHSGKVIVKGVDGNECTYNAQIGLTGDGRDHLRSYFNSSLKIKLESGNLAGVTRFKLLVPDTRLDSNEIFATQFMRSVGFLSPITKKIEVKIENQIINYTFQEQFAKELIERNDLPEGFLVEGNEKTLSREIEVNSGVMFKPLARVIKSSWIELESNRVPFALNLLNFINTLYLHHYSLDDPRLLRMSSDISSEFFTNNGTFNILSMAIRAEHGLAIHNRRFYFNPFSFKLEPSYYDGMSRILEPIGKLDFIEVAKFNGFDSKAYTVEEWKTTSSLLSGLDQQSFRKRLCISGLCLSEEELASTINEISRNVSLLSETSTPTKKLLTRDFYRTAERVPGFLGFLSGENLTICTSQLNSCFKQQSKISKEEMRSYVYGDLFYKGEHVRPLVKNLRQYVTRNYIFTSYLEPQKKFRNKNEKISGLTTIGEVKLQLDLEQKKLIAISLSEDARIELNSGYFNGWKISFINLAKRSNKSISSSILKNDACITLYNTELINSKISVTNCSLGDGLNAVKSLLKNSEVAIRNSLGDGIDSDMTSILKSRIQVIGAGGDCSDFSFSNVSKSIIQVENCYDKGISVGEASRVSLQRVTVDNAYLGIAVKDSSVLMTDSANVKASICYLAFRKKQEFAGGRVYLKNVSNERCMKMKSYEQIGSKVVIGEFSNRR
jgi:hypothetical protein